MANWHYYTEAREKIGPIEGSVLKQLTRQGIITPDTFIEDPTGRTGLAKDVKGLKFPETVSPEPVLSVDSNPFTTPALLPPSAQTVPMPPVVSPLGTAHSFGRVLASGNGKGNPAILLWNASFIVGAVLWFGFFAYSAYDLGRQIAPEQEARAQVSRQMQQRNIPLQLPRNPELERAERAMFIRGGLAVLLPFLWIVYGTIYQRCIMGTYIRVCENGIEGKGAGKHFNVGDPRIFAFRLAHNQITSIDVGGSTMIIHAWGHSISAMSRIRLKYKELSSTCNKVDTVNSIFKNWRNGCPFYLKLQRPFLEYPSGQRKRCGSCLVFRRHQRCFFVCLEDHLVASYCLFCYLLCPLQLYPWCLHLEPIEVNTFEPQVSAAYRLHLRLSGFL